MTTNEAKLQVQYEDELDELGNEVDPGDIFGILTTIADQRDIDLIEVLDGILQGKEFGIASDELLIQDILEQTQSNFDRAILSLRQMIILNEKIANLGI